MKSKPSHISNSRPASNALRLVRLIGSLVVVLIAMYIAYQKAQDPAAPPPAPPGKSAPVDLPEAKAPEQETTDSTVTASKTTPVKRPSDGRVESQRRVKTEIKNARIRNQDGRVVFEGTVDLRDTLDRIERGQRGSHGNDGTVFQNREKRLPQKPSGYYHEWVHPTPNLRGPGPQRIVTGENGEVYYTPDHYKTFQRLDGM